MRMRVRVCARLDLLPPLTSFFFHKALRRTPTCNLYFFLSSIRTMEKIKHISDSRTQAASPPQELHLKRPGLTLKAIDQVSPALLIVTADNALEVP